MNRQDISAKSLLASLAAVALTGTGLAQGTLWSASGTTSNEYLGQVVTPVGDIDQDGVEEIAIGMPSQSTKRGQAQIRSGADGTVLYQNLGVANNTQFGRSFAGGGDFNGDGYLDVAISSPIEPSNDGRVRILNGIHLVNPFQPAIIDLLAAGGSNRRFGWSLLTIEDVDGDLVPDLLVGAPAFSGGIGRIRVYSGATLGSGSPVELYVFAGPSLFGYSLAQLGDIDGDTVPDFAVGCPEDGCNLNAGSVYVISGQSGAPIQIGGVSQICGASADGQLGFSLSSGDVNGDGTLDLIAGSPFTPEGGRVEVISIQPLAFLARLDGQVANEDFGTSVSAGGDFDGDGFRDVLVGLGSGGARLYSGRGLDSASLPQLEFSSAVYGMELGAEGTVALTSSLDGDSLGECVLGAPEAAPNGVTRAGQMSVLLGEVFPAGVSSCFGDGGNQTGCTSCPCGNDAPQGSRGGCANSTGSFATLRASGTPRVAADTLRFEMTGGTIAAFAILFSGDNLAPANPTNPCFGLASGLTSVTLDGLRCAVGAVQRHGSRAMDPNGGVGLTNAGWGSPNGPVGGLAAQGGFTAGQTRHYQVIYREEVALGCMRALNTSQAVSIEFQP